MKLGLKLATQKKSECALLTAELENVELRLRELEATAFSEKEICVEIENCRLKK